MRPASGFIFLLILVACTSESTNVVQGSGGQSGSGTGGASGAATGGAAGAATGGAAGASTGGSAGATGGTGGTSTGGAGGSAGATCTTYSNTCADKCIDDIAASGNNAVSDCVQDSKCYCDLVCLVSGQCSTGPGCSTNQAAEVAYQAVCGAGECGFAVCK